MTKKGKKSKKNSNELENFKFMFHISSSVINCIADKGNDRTASKILVLLSLLSTSFFAVDDDVVVGVTVTATTFK